MTSISNIFYNYCLTRTDKCDPFYPELDQPFWFGKGCNGRMLVHRKDAKKCQKDPSLPRDIRINVILKLWALGLDFAEEKICINLFEQEAFEIEMGAIAKYGRINNGTGCLANLTDGGEGSSGTIYSEESKQKMRKPKTEEQKKNQSKSMIGKYPSKETRKKMSEAKKGKPPPNKGKPMSEEQRQKITGENNGHWGIPRTEDQKKAQSERMSGEKHPMHGKHHKEEAIVKIKEARKKQIVWNKGKTFSEESKKKMSESRKLYCQLKREQKLAEEITSQEEDK
jgi:hypothetical protein